MKVLLVDFDPKGNLTDYFLDKNPIKRSPFEKIYDRDFIYDHIVKVRKDLFVLPATRSLYDFDKLNGSSNRTDSDTSSIHYFSNVFKHLRFDYILIDTLPTFGHLTLNAIDFTKQIVVPVSMTHWAYKSLLELDEKIFTFTTEGRIYKIIPNMYDNITTVSKMIHALLVSSFGPAVTNTTIPKRVILEKLSAESKTIYDTAPNDEVADAFRDLSREFLIK
jgi:chromosome partitioning protein